MAANDFDAKQSARYIRVLIVTELVLSGTQCTQSFLLNIDQGKIVFVI